MSEESPEVDEQVDALYQEDAADFVARRNALAKAIRADGDKDLAAVVAKLRKPPRTASVLSEFARSDPGAVLALLDAALAVAASLRGGGADLREAQAEYNSVVANLVERAADAGDLTSDAMRERMRSTLLAAGADPEGEVARQLSIGALRDDADAPGFAFGIVGPLSDPTGDGASGDGEQSAAAPDGDSGEARPRRRLRSVRTSAKSTSSGAADAAPAVATDEPAVDDTDAAEQLEAALRERERLAAERAEAEREATARREAMRRRRSIERDLSRVERRAARLAEQADEAEAKASLARRSADEAVAELEALRSRLDDIDA